MLLAWVHELHTSAVWLRYILPFPGKLFMYPFPQSTEVRFPCVRVSLNQPALSPMRLSGSFVAIHCLRLSLVTLSNRYAVSTRVTAQSLSPGMSASYQEAVYKATRRGVEK